MAIESEADKKKKYMMQTLEQPPIGESGMLPPPQPVQQEAAPAFPYQKRLQQVAERRAGMQEPQQFVTGGIVEDENTTGLSTPSGSATIGASAAPAPGAVPGAQPSREDAPQGSGSFVNPKQYIEANRPKTQQLAQRITGGFQQEAQDVRSQIARKRVAAEAQLGKEQTRLDKATPWYTKTLGQAGSANPTDSTSGSSTYTPTFNQPSESDIARFQRLSSGTGALQVDSPELTKQRLSAADLQRRSKEFGTSKGRMEELSRAVGKQSSRYTGGQKALDTLLLGGDAAQRSTGIRSAQAATKGLGQQVGALQTDIAARLGEQKSQRDTISIDALQALKDRRTGVASDVTDSVKAAKLKQDTLRARVGSGQALSPEDMAAIGIDPSTLTKGQLDRQFGVSAGDFVNYGTVTKDVARTAQEAAQMNALRALAGQEPLDIQAGTGQLATGGQGFADVVGKRGGEYRAEKSGLEGQIADAQAADASELQQRTASEEQNAMRDNPQWIGFDGKITTEGKKWAAERAAYTMQQQYQSQLPGLQERLAGIDARYGGAPVGDATQGGKFVLPADVSPTYIPTKLG